MVKIIANMKKSKSTLMKIQMKKLSKLINPKEDILKIKLHGQEDIDLKYNYNPYKNLINK